MRPRSKTIPLTRGLVTVVDDDVFEIQSAFKWYAKDCGGKVYAARNIRRPDGSKTSLYLHRAIAGDPAGQDVDHRDGDTLNNRRSNLRPCSRRDNIRSQRRSAAKTSRFKGVCWYRAGSKWVAQIKASGTRYLGYFLVEEEAARAYDRAAREHFGEFAVLNFPLETP